MTDSDNEVDDEYEVIENKERGCGFLENDKVYLKSEFHKQGELPPFIRLHNPLPFKEGHFRGYKMFPGIRFELINQLEYNYPEEWEDHIDRLKNHEELGEHMGEMKSATTHDLIMWVGESYYSQPEDFIGECLEQGLNKAIPVSKKNKPPTIDEGRTRVFILHPNATEDDEPGLIGYSYITRIVYTRPEDGNVPKWAQDYSKAGYFDIVDAGPEEERDENPNIESLDDL